MEFKPFKIGKFLLLERIATGGMAEVYRAKASGAGGFEKQLALKRIIPSYSQNEEFRRMFEYEARLSSMLTHANIVQVYDFVKSGDTYLLAMEYVDGKNLRQVINKEIKSSQMMPIEASVFIINEVCKGLGYAHDKKDEMRGRPLHIIHRDMSPQNIMLSYEGNVKIVDFGIAKAKDRVDETRSGVIKGKFGYMSPEQASGEEIDHRTDIFSTGIILYEMLTQKRLFAADNDMATLKRIQECIIQRPTLVNPKIPIELEKILLKALAKDRNLRYQTALEFHKKLQEFINKFYPAYTQVEISQMLTKLFEKEIQIEKKRIEAAYKQSIPFSQGAAPEKPSPDGSSGTDFDQVDDALDGAITQSEHESVTMVTDASAAPEEEVTPPPIDQLEAKTAKEEIPTEAAPEDDGATAASNATWEAPPEPPMPSFTSPGTDPGISRSHAMEPSSDDEVSDEQSIGEDLSLAETPDTNPGGEKSETDIGAPLEDTNTGTPTVASQRQVADPEIIQPGGEQSHTELASPEDDEGESSEITEVPEPGEPQTKTPTQTRTPTQSKTGLGNRVIEQAEGPDPSISFVNDYDQIKPPPAPTDRKKTDTGSFGHLPTNPSSSNIQIDEQTNSQVARFPTPERRESNVMRSLLTFVLAIFVIVGSAFLYLEFTTGEETVPVGTGPDTTTSEPTRRVPTTQNAVRGTGNCILSLDTDPRKATIWIDGETRGLTPNVTAVRCGQPSTIELKLEGYQRIKKRLIVDDEAKLYETLSPIPMGTLRLTLSHNAMVYVNGNEKVIEAVASTPFEIRLEAGQTYSVFFENKPLGIKLRKNYTLRANTVVTERINLDLR